MRDVVLGNGLIDSIARNSQALELVPACGKTLKAGWTQVTGCSSCARRRRIKAATQIMDPNARNRFKRCLMNANPEDVARLKKLLQVDTITVYDRSDGKLKTVKL